MGNLTLFMHVSLDGFGSGVNGQMDWIHVDDEIFDYGAERIYATDTALYGRKTYQLMESYWPTVVKNPTGNKPEDEFAVLIDNISKIVFSRTLKNVDWKNTELKKEVIKAEISELKHKADKDILVGSPSLIVATMNLNLIDEFQLCIHPVVAGKGLPLFENLNDRKILKLIKTKIFSSGAVTLYFEPAKN